MSTPMSWRLNGSVTPEQVEAGLTALSRLRALTLEESLRLEWAIKAQIDDDRRQAGKYIPKSGPRKAMMEDHRAAELALADRIEWEMHQPRWRPVGDDGEPL